MNLTDLDATFLRLKEQDGSRWSETGGAFDGADGVMFLCPKCYAANMAKCGDGRMGTHMVMCWFVGRVPDGIDPKPGRWTPSGTGLHDLTFVPGSPARAVSVLLTAGCGWHGFVRDGDAA